MSIARKILSNTSFQIAGKAVTALLSIVAMKIIAVYLGTAGAGQYTTVYEFLAFFGIIADLGLYTIAVREMSADEKKTPFILGNILGMRTALVVLAMALAIVAAFLIPKYAATVIPLGVAIASVATILTMLNGTIASVLQVRFQMKYHTLGLVAGKIVSVAYMAFAAFVAYKGDLRTGFYHLLFAGVIGNAVMLMITARYTARFVNIRYRFDGVFWKRVFLTALPYGIALFLNTVYFRLDTLMMSLLLRSDPALVGQGGAVFLCQQAANYLTAECQVGFYSIAMRMTEVLLIIPVYFLNSVLPVLTRFLKEARERVPQLLDYCFAFLLALAAPIMAGGYVLAYPLIFVISDAEFLSRAETGAWGSDLALKLLLVAMLCAFINAMFGILLVAVNKQALLLYVNGAAVLFNFVGNWWVIPFSGFRGAAWTSIGTELIILIATFLLARRYLPLRINWARTGKIVFSALLMGLILNYLKIPTYALMENNNILLLIPVGGLIYACSLLATRAVDKEMKRILLRR